MEDASAINHGQWRQVRAAVNQLATSYYIHDLPLHVALMMQLLTLP